MSLYESTFHVTPDDLCFIFQCKLYIYAVSCLVEIKLFQIILNKLRFSNLLPVTFADDGEFDREGVIKFTLIKFIPIYYLL